MLDCTEPLFASHPTRWAVNRKALQRSGASWVRVLEPEGGSVLLGTVPLFGGVPVGSIDAVVQLGKTLRAIRRPQGTQKYRPVTCSRDWKAPPRQPPKWKVIGKVGDQAAVIGCLKRHGIEGKSRLNPEAVWTIAWQIPDDWPETKIRALESELSPLICIKTEENAE